MEAGRISIGTRTTPSYERGGPFGFMRGAVPTVSGRLLRLVLSTLTVALFSTLLIFALAYFSPSNPAATKLGESATPAAIAHLNHAMGLDRGFFAQYFSWIGNAIHGDLGVSWFSGVPVGNEHQDGAAGRPLGDRRGPGHGAADGHPGGHRRRDPARRLPRPRHQRDLLDRDHPAGLLDRDGAGDRLRGEGEVAAGDRLRAAVGGPLALAQPPAPARLRARRQRRRGDRPTAAQLAGRGAGRELRRRRDGPRPLAAADPLPARAAQRPGADRHDHRPRDPAAARRRGRHRGALRPARPRPAGADRGAGARPAGDPGSPPGDGRRSSSSATWRSTACSAGFVPRPGGNTHERHPPRLRRALDQGRRLRPVRRPHPDDHRRPAGPARSARAGRPEPVQGPRPRATCWGPTTSAATPSAG